MYDHRSCLACLGIQLHEDSVLNPPMLLPQFTCIFGDGRFDNDNLDQPFQLEEGLFMSMLSCDLVQTKNLAAEQSAIAHRLRITLEQDKVRVEKAIKK